MRFDIIDLYKRTCPHTRKYFLACGHAIILYYAYRVIVCVCVCVCVCVINNSDLCKPPAQVLGLFNFIATLFITLHSFLATKIHIFSLRSKQSGKLFIIL